MNESVGKFLIVIGILVLLVGITLYFKLPIGKLSGDIRIERENFRFYFPITTCIIISVIFMLLINLLKK